MNGVISIGTLQMALAYVYVLVLMAIVKKRGIGGEREILWSSFRMTVQLVAVGYVLGFMFTSPHPLATVSVYALMQVFAVHTILGRLRFRPGRQLKKVIAGSLVVGTTVSTAYFLLAVIGLKPWFDPRYFIPVAGMIVGNSMTGVAVGIERLHSSIKNRRDLIETALMLGAPPELAARDAANEAFWAAVLPTINSMLGMGIVFLPGMMTGQILAGVSPLTAIEYQIAVMLAILGGVTAALYLLVDAGTRTYFNRRCQLDLAD
ncbi:MAG: iron export ABC transporter permease subunit FetB [Bacillota bacterium]